MSEDERLRFEVRMQNVGGGDTAGCFSTLHAAILAAIREVDRGSKWARVVDSDTRSEVFVQVRATEPNLQTLARKAQP